MKLNGNQRKVYLLALGILLTAVVLVSAWSLWRKSFSDQRILPISETEAAKPDPVPEGESALSESAPLPETEKASTIVYYQDNDGYLVPVMCTVPMEDGIAKATLNLMVQNPGNDMQAARLGLRTVLPENTKIDLDISDGLARIDLSREVLELADAAAEQNMVSAVVQALTEFDTVREVEFLIDGQKKKELPHGTDISQRFRRGDINLESAQETMSLADAKPVQLYFPSDAGTVVVPVTRLVYSSPDLNTAVLELVKGPCSEGSLEGVLPAGCGLIDVTVKDGTAKLNFTREFADLALNSDGGRMAMKALVLTCTQFDGIKKVEILVEGEAFDPGRGTLSIPTFVNVADTVVYDYIQTQSAMIFGD